MNSASRFLLILVALVGLFAGASWVQPSWFAAVGLDVWSLPDLHRELDQGLKRSRELDDYDCLVFDRLMAKEDAVSELIAGRWHLKEAVARFRELNEQPPSLVEETRKFYPLATHDEAVSRQVLAWVEARMQVQPGEDAPAVRVRLKAEAKELLPSP